MSDTGYADDRALLANTLSQVKSLLHNLEQTAERISLYFNTNKTEFMFFEQKGDIFTLCGKPLKLVDHFPYVVRNISSTESDVNIRLVMACSAINMLLIIWKSARSDKIEQDFVQGLAVSILPYCCTTWILMKYMKKKTDGYLPPISQTIQVTRTRHVEYCCRRKDKFISTFSYGLLHTDAMFWPTSKDLHQPCANTRCIL